jgi:carbamoylphosphate synthase small subunit
VQEYLTLANGRVFQGKALEHRGDLIGEIVFHNGDDRLSGDVDRPGVTTDRWWLQTFPLIGELRRSSPKILSKKNPR